MPYHQLFYHLVWSTRNRAPWISPEVEPVLHSYLRSKAKHLKAYVHALNGTEDHVHVLVSIPPSVALSTFVGQLKASSSTRINRDRLLGHAFAWQREYGAFTFDRKRLPPLRSYVEHQKTHHAEGSTISSLERWESRTQLASPEGAPLT